MNFCIKKYLLSLILIVGLSGCGGGTPKQYADYSTGSGFAASDSVSIDNLEVLARVWGFVKYHHPAFSGGSLDADAELFELLPRVAAGGKEERNAVLLGWVRGLGKFRSAEGRYFNKIERGEYVSPTDWGWLEDETLLGGELAATLRDLRYAKCTKPSRYARIVTGGYIDFDAESDFAPFFSDAGYNLLTLFRLWNMAEYYFPSVGLTNKKWAYVLREYIPKFLATKSVRWTIAELIAELSDTHAGMSNNPVYGGYRLPVDLKFVEGKLVVTRAMMGNDELRTGDVIESIDDHASEYFVEWARRYISVSNESVLLRQAAQMAAWSETENTSVVVERDGERWSLDLACVPNGERQRLPRYKLLSPDVGYIYAANFYNKDNAAIMAQFADARAIIVDMRCYPSDFMPFEFVGRYFVPEKVQHVAWMMPVGKQPGYYRKESTSLGFKNDSYYKGKVVVLVNEYTQSSAEYQTMAW